MNTPVSVDPQRQFDFSFGYELVDFVEREKRAAIENKKETIKRASDWRRRQLADVPYITDADFSTSAEYVTVILPDDNADIETDVGLYEDHIVAVIDETDNLYEGQVLKIAGNTMRISVGDGGSIEYSTRQTLRDQSESLAVAGILHPVQYDRQISALRSFQLSLEKSEIIRGQRPLTFENSIIDESDPIDDELYDNQKQAEGIQRALTADQLVCLQGPPGTGKTRVIIELVRRLVRAGQRVLVTAETNAAADNILIGENDEEDRDPQSLHMYNSACYSFGRFSVARNNYIRSDSSVVHEKYRDIATEDAQVVVSTNNSAERLRGQEFDYAIVDEAAQAMLTSTLIPYTIADKLILVGDHKQMPPERQSDPASDTDTRHLSLFQRIYDDDIGAFGSDAGVQFKTQYRMHPEIARLPNQLFYNGQLETGIDPEPILSHPVVVFDILDTSEQWMNSSPYNDGEAHFALLQAKYLLQNGVSGADIGIITPYTGQVERIGQLIRAMDDDRFTDITVDTIASFQGSEKPATIISFTRANDDGNVGFLDRDDGPNRLNVALSRGKRYTALIGNWKTLRTNALYDDVYDLVTSETPAQEYAREDVVSQL